MITKWGDVTDDTPVEDIWTGVDLTATAAAARSSSHTSTPTSSTPAPSARLLTVINPTLRGNDTDLASRQAANRANKERDKQGKKAKQAERESEMERELFEVIREQQEMIKRQEDWMKRQDDAWKRQRQKQQEAHDDLARRVSELMAYGREQEDETARQQARIAGLEAEVKELREITITSEQSSTCYTVAATAHLSESRVGCNCKAERKINYDCTWLGHSATFIRCGSIQTCNSCSEDRSKTEWYREESRQWSCNGR